MSWTDPPTIAPEDLEEWFGREAERLREVNSHASMDEQRQALGTAQEVARPTPSPTAAGSGAGSAGPPDAPADGDGGRSYPCPSDVSQSHPLTRVFRVSVKSYPDGGERLTVTRAADGASRPHAPFCDAGIARCPFDYRRIRLNEDNARRAIGRSRQVVADRVRCNGLDHLLTLTAGKAFKSRTALLDAFAAYLQDKRHGRWFGDYLHGHYVAVGEPFQDGDGWHLHVAIAGRIPSAKLQRLKATWTAYLRERHGIQPPKTMHGLWRVNVQAPGPKSTPKALGRYLAKYVGKAFETLGQLNGTHRYRSGLFMAGPTVSSYLADLSEDGFRLLFASYGDPFEIRHPVTGWPLGWTAERGP